MKFSAVSKISNGKTPVVNPCLAPEAVEETELEFKVDLWSLIIIAN